MKKILAIIAIIGLTALLGGWFSADNGEAAAQEEISQGQLIRFHVLANTDSDADQLLKRQVRDAILAKFSPALGKVPSLEESRQVVRENLKAMENEAARVIAAKGKDYAVKAEYGYFNFPAKSYGELTLPAGRYEAVRIVIGEGKGANWWCVLFPPLCFIDVTSTLSHNPALVQPALQESQQELKPMVKIKALEVVKELFKGKSETN